MNYTAETITQLVRHHFAVTRYHKEDDEWSVVQLLILPFSSPSRTIIYWVVDNNNKQLYPKKRNSQHWWWNSSYKTIDIMFSSNIVLDINLVDIHILVFYTIGIFNKNGRTTIIHLPSCQQPYNYSNLNNLYGYHNKWFFPLYQRLSYDMISTDIIISILNDTIYY